VSGEEKGLLGSRYYADNPTVPLEGIIANINIDMIGRNSPDTVVAIGQEFSSLGPLTVEVLQQHPELRLIPTADPWPEERFFFRSDQFNFARKEIPAIFFFSGTHEDYHRPSDHVDKIDTDKAARIGRLVFWLTHAIATDPQPPAWTPDGLAQVRALIQNR
jgi:Zn-dependent M28 family amino/carboxypeptidase